MEKILHLYKYVDGVNDSPFPSNEQQATLYEFKYDAKRMGNNAPTITGTIMHPLCLDELWGNGQVYVFYNGERYFLKQTPTSSYSNEDTRYKHEVDFVSERALLNDVYFYDVVTGDVSNDKPVSNSSNVVFYGDIHELAKRLNYSLQYANLEYSVVVDEGITSESKLVSFQKQFFANVLQEGYKLFEIPYYYVGKVIHFGYTNNSIDRVFSQGVQDALLSISKNNITQRIVNRITGVGSVDNIPYYYPNFDPKGETEVLYNGSTSNSVSIDNVSKYKKIKLGDTFTYTYEGDKRIEYVDKENYEVVREPELVSENYEEFTRRYELAISFPLNVDIATDATLVLGYDKAFLKNFAALVYRGSELVTRLTSLGTYYNFRVKEDYTNITIALTFEFGFNDEKQEVTMDDIPNIVDSLVVSIYSDVQGYEQWALNKESNKVSLSDYGLKLNSSPTNGDKITFRQVTYIPPQLNLMPPIYRESLGAERFYNALNNTYYDKVLGKYYSFDNPFIVGKNKEDDITFEDIKPSIKGVTNANSERIDVFSEFAWDENDNDEFDEEGNYLHPYFFGKLRKFDGDFGFNLFDHAIEEDEMVISMTSGNCGGCNFVIGVDNERQKNIVQVDENGNLKRDSNGNVLYGSPQDRQNDTSKYEVWVALKKDIDTFGVIMPNATNNYKPNVGDTFVILHIDLPNAYILASEERLKEELIKYMANNNSEKFNFSLSFSRIFFAENPTLLSQLNENARIKVAYNNNIYSLYVSSYSYSMSNDSALPEIRVELSEELDIVKESIVKQLANASLYLNQEVKKVNMSVATTNTNVAKNSTTAQVSITQTNARVDDVEKVVRNIQAQGTQSGLNKSELEEYLTNNQYAKLSDIPSLEGYALASDLTALRTDFDNLNTLLNGNVGGIIDTWNEVVSFLDGYSQSDDLAAILSGMNEDISNRVLTTDFEKANDSIKDLLSYFDANGNANNALKLGGQLPSYYATVDALNIVKNDVTAVSNRVQKFEDVIGIDSNGDVYIKGMRNFYTEQGTIGMAGLGSGGSGGGGGTAGLGSVTVRVNGQDYITDASGIVTIPSYPTSLPASDVYSWAKAATKPTYTASEVGALSTSGGTLYYSGNWGLKLSSTSGDDNYIWLEGIVNGSTNLLGGYGVKGYNNPVYVSPTGYTYPIYHTGNFNPSNYLPLSGGTIKNGSVRNPLSIDTTDSTGAYLVMKANGASKAYFGYDSSLGTLIQDNSDSFTILYIRNGHGYIGNQNKWNTLIHSGNYTDYALSLSGGLMQGDITLPTNIFIRSGSNGYAIIGIDGDKVLLGSHDYHAQIRSNTTPTAVIGGTEYTIYHTGNFNPANYLPLSGGTISGKLYKRTTGLNYITFEDSNGGTYGHLGFNGANTPMYMPKEENAVYALIHSGNYSSYALPLSGGTLSGGITVNNPSADALTINRTDGGWAYINYKVTGSVWHVGVPGTSRAGMLGTSGDYEIRSLNQDDGSYTGLSIRANTSNFGKVVISSHSSECSIGFRNTSDITVVPQWVFGMKDTTHFGVWSTEAGRFIITTTPSVMTLTIPMVFETPTTANNDYNEGVRFNLGGQDNWAGFVIGGARGSISGSSEGVYSFLVNNKNLMFRHENENFLEVNTLKDVVWRPRYFAIVSGNSECGIRFGGVDANNDFVGRFSTYVSLYNVKNSSNEIKIPDSGSATIGGNTIWHAGNSNLSTVDWNAREIYCGLLSMNHTAIGPTLNLKHTGSSYSWNYINQESNGYTWHIGVCSDSSGSDRLESGAYEIRGNGQNFQGIFIRPNTSSYGKLVVANNTGAETSIGFLNTRHSYDYPVWTVGTSIGDGSVTTFGWFYSNAGARAWLTAEGNLTVTGDITSEGTIAMAKLASSSDAKLKENIKWLSADRAMGVVRALRPTEWDWKKDHTHSFGFIAQDVQPIIPEMVSSVNDTLRLEYNQLHAFEIGAIQHIDSEVETLKKDLKTANNRIEVLENELNKYRRNA